jgi:cyanophycinase
MTGIMALYGSGEFTTAMSDVDLFVLGSTPAPNVAIIPTAAGMEDDYRHWINDGIAHYQKLGIEVAGLDVRTRDDANDKKLMRQVDDYTCFVFSGGDPGYLLEVLDGSLLWKKIMSLYEQGATIIGSSAGAMVMGPYVWSSVYKFDADRTLEPWAPGLQVIDFGVLPHFDFIEREFNLDERRAAYANIPQDIKVVGIDEDTAYIKIKEDWIKKGKGKIHDPIVREL